MTFRKKHKLGFVTEREKPLTTTVCLKMDEELAQRLKAVEGWQELLRQELPQLIEKWKPMKPS